MNYKTFNIFILVLGALVIIGSVYAFSQEDETDNNSNSSNDATITLGSLTFFTSIGDALHRAQAEEKMIYIYGRSEFCGWCKKFEAESFTDNNVTSLLNENFVLLSIDTVNQRNTAVSLGIRSTPTSIFTTPKGQEIPGTRIPGYADPVTFHKHLKEVINKEE